jgi:hypothetical protein
LRRDGTLFQKDVHEYGTPGIDQLGFKDRLAVTSRGLEQDDARVRAPQSQSWTCDVVGR